MTHTVKSLKALLREYKHLHSFAYSKMKKHELYAIALKLGLINEDSLNVKKVKKEKVKRIKKVKNDKVIVDNDREKLKQNINNLIISEQLKTDTKKKELKSIMDKYDYETKKIDKLKSGVIKKDIVKDKDDDFDTVSQKLQQLIYLSPLSQIQKSLWKMQFKGSIQTNKTLLNLQIMKQFNTVDKMKSLINIIEKIQADLKLQKESEKFWREGFWNN